MTFALIAIAFATGALGTLVGAGGGIILVPVLLHMFPEAHAAWIGGISMGMVALNATSGTFTYYYKKTIHLRSGVIFALASLPGSIAGVYLEQLVDRHIFERVFGGVMVVFGMILIARSGRKRSSGIAAATRLDMDFYVKGIAMSLVVGLLASFLGIGGGVIHVPLLTEVLNFPVHLATGTSHFILAITAWCATVVHLLSGDISLSEPIFWQVGLAAAAGAQLGARLSPRVSGPLILRILAVALFLVGLRLLSR